MSLNKNFFTNVPVEFSIPKRVKIVAVSDYFTTEISGGAEVTLETILDANKKDEVFKIHSSSLTVEMVSRNKDKCWIFGNYTMVDNSVIKYFINNKLNYSIIEFDFKYCKFRAPNGHFVATGKRCDCVTNDHGKLVENFCLNSQKMFWMSDKQKEYFLTQLPSLKNIVHVTQGSMFSKETLNYINKIRKSKDSRKPHTAILGGGSWIKGIPETISLLNFKKIKFEQIPGMEYKKFLEELSKFSSVTILPLDFDTAPRVAIEAKLLGCELVTNENVLIKDDEWLNQEPELLEKYLLDKLDNFWSNISV
jgi:hypothetical protein